MPIAENLWKAIGYEPHPKQLEFHKSLARFKLASCGRRFGKALQVDTLVPTPAGWKTMGELRVGEYVFGADGEPTVIEAVSEVMYDRPCYRVVFSDGSEIVADEDHEWYTWDKAARKVFSDPRRNALPGLRTTGEIGRTLMVGKECNHAVRVCGAVQYEEKKLLIDPYVLGVWLGDGNAAEGGFTCADPEIVAAVDARGYEVRKRNSQYGYGILGLHVELKALGLIKNKHVPAAYLQGSVEQRLDLLQGLMDTDGSVGGQGQCDFTNMSFAITEGLAQLAESLGCKVVRGTRRAILNGKDCGLAYRLNITALWPLFKLDRKLKQQFARKFSSSRQFRFVRKVERVESVPVRCIQVAGEMYLAGLSFIMTHNSKMAAVDVEPEMLDHRRPTRGWIVAPQYKLGEKEFRYIWEDLVIGLGLGPQIKKKAYNMRTGEMYIEMPWGSRVDVMSGEHPDSLVGEGLDWVIFSEAAKLSPQIWEKYVRPSLADRQGRAIFPSTPEGFNWFYDMYRQGQDPKFPDWESWRYPSWENPYVYPLGFDDPEIQSQLRSPDDPWFWQEIGADFRAVVGLVYPEWDDAVNIKHWDYDPSLPNYMAFDFGFTNPFACLEIQVTPSDELRIWREYYKKGLSPEEHAVALKARHNPQGYQIMGAFGDAADPAAVRTLTRDLTPVIAMDQAKGWMEGIQAVKGFLARKDGLWVDPTCTATIAEFNSYKIKAPSKIRDPRDNLREEAEKRDDHALDAFRYFVMHRFVLGADSHIDSEMLLSTQMMSVEGTFDDLVGMPNGIFTRDMEF